MLALWRSHKYDKENIMRAARLGAEALWRRYRTDESFRRGLDLKLRKSRARGGSISLRNLGEVGFKSRLRLSGAHQVRPVYSDVNGNRLRSSFEVTIANALARNGIPYSVEPRFVVGDHAFYPDFIIGDDRRHLVEVVGYMGDRYWDGTATKIRLILKEYPYLKVAVVTTFVTIMNSRLRGSTRVSIFRPYQVDELVRWCRGARRGSKKLGPKAERLLRGP